MCEAPRVVDGVPFSDFSAIGDQNLADDVWGYSYGGFQIRSLRDQKGTGGIRDENRLLEPRFNARSALAIRRSQGWNAWTTYTSGMFKAYLQDIYPPAPNTYVVIAGDTLSLIGSRLGIPWEEIARLNNIVSPYRLQIGQVIRLP